MSLPRAVPHAFATVLTFAAFATPGAAQATPPRGDTPVGHPSGAAEAPPRAQGSTAEVAGCADFSSGAPRRLRILRVTGWSLIPVGMTISLALTDRSDLHRVRVMTGVGVGLIGAGLALGTAAGIRLRHHCREDAAFAARLIHRVRWTGLSILGAGAVGTLASLVAMAAEPPTDESGDFSPGPGILVGCMVGVVLVGAAITAVGGRLRRTRTEIAVGAGTLHLRTTF